MSGRKVIDRTGLIYNQLTVISYAFTKNNHAYWHCECNCGKVITISASNLLKTISCGCFKVESNTTHGMSRTPELGAWRNMKDRCYNPNNYQYKRYGGRGIKVCKRWRHSFENFFKDMGLRPSSQHSLDRINNFKGYKKSNCRWATKSEQSLNRRPYGKKNKA